MLGLSPNDLHEINSDNNDEGLEYEHTMEKGHIDSTHKLIKVLHESSRRSLKSKLAFGGTRNSSGAVVWNQRGNSTPGRMNGSGQGSPTESQIGKLNADSGLAMAAKRDSDVTKSPNVKSDRNLTNSAMNIKGDNEILKSP